MNFSYCTLRLLVWILFVCVGLTGCAGFSGGTVGRAWTVNGKCEAILNWVQQFEKEFPLRSIGLDGGQSPATVANLYRPEVFEPAFGFPYDKAHEAAINDIAQDVLPYCYGAKQGVKAETVQALQPLRKLVDPGFPFREVFVYLATERTKDEAWRQKSLSEVSSVPATQDGFKNIQDYYLGTGEKRIQNLWTSEQENYLRKVKARRGDIAKILLDDFIPPPDTLPNYQASLDKIGEARPYLIALKESGDEGLRAVAERYHAKERSIVAALMQEQIGELRDIPHNQDGFRLSQVWLEEFERRFIAYSDMEEVKRARGEFLRKREAIFEANREVIYGRFSSLDLGNAGRQKEKTLIAETFPLPSDYQLPFYREFRSHHRNRGDSAVLDLLDKSKNAVVDYYKAISGFAKDMLYGSPE